MPQTNVCTRELVWSKYNAKINCGKSTYNHYLEKPTFHHYRSKPRIEGLPSLCAMFYNLHAETNHHHTSSQYRQRRGKRRMKPLPSGFAKVLKPSGDGLCVVLEMLRCVPLPCLATRASRGSLVGPQGDGVATKHLLHY